MDFCLHHLTLKTYYINPLNAKLNLTCHLLALLGAHHILHVSRIRVKVLLLLLQHLKICIKSRNNVHLGIWLGPYKNCINLQKMQNNNNYSNDDRSDDNNSTNECEFQIFGRRKLVHQWIMVAGPWPLFTHKTVANHRYVWCGTTWWYKHYNTLVTYTIKIYKHVTFCALKITKYYIQLTNLCHVWVLYDILCSFMFRESKASEKL
jgi:hypothetical protein